MSLLVNNEAIEAVNAGEEMPETLTVNGKEMFRLSYHRTDAWRGYYEAEPIAEGIEKVDEGWVTGDYDDAPSGARSSNVQAKLERLASDQEEEGRDVIVVFAPTSNVFSTSFDVFTVARD